MRALIGKSEFELGGPDLGELMASNDIIDDVPALRKRFEQDGYLLLRGLQKPKTVLAARRTVLTYLKQRGCLDPKAALMDGLIDTSKGPRGGFKGDPNPREDGAPLVLSPGITGMVESPEIIGFFERFLGGPILPFKHRWMRIAGTGGGTAMHYDIVYMSRGTTNVRTVWCPMGDVPYELGGLALCVGSHRWDELKNTYGKADVDVDRGPADSFRQNTPLEVARKYGGQWRTTSYSAGDVLIFGMYTLHAPLTNQTNRFRLSTDTRYQLVSDPADERWMSDGHVERSFIGGGG